MDGNVVALQSDCFHKTSWTIWTIDDWGHYTVQWAAVKTHQNSVQIQSLQNPWQCELCVHKSLLDVIIHLQDLVWGCSCFLLALGWWRESKPAASIWTWSSSNWCYYPNGLRTWCRSIVALNAPTCPNSSQDAPTCANKRQCHKMSQDVTRCHKMSQGLHQNCARLSVQMKQSVLTSCFYMFSVFTYCHRSSRSSHTANRKEMKIMRKINCKLLCPVPVST